MTLEPMQLVFTALGAHHPSLIVEMTRAIKEAKCNIIESRLTELGTHFAGHFLVEGNWNHIARLENSLDALGNRFELKVNHQRIQESEEPIEEEDQGLPYAIDIFATDQINNVHELTEFLDSRGIEILDMSTSRQAAPFTGSPLFLAHIVIKVPPGTRMISLRDEFLDFCDQMGLDAILEPVKR